MLEDETIHEQSKQMNARGFSIAGLGSSVYYHRACGMMFYRRTDYETGGDYATADAHRDSCPAFRNL